MESIAPIAWTAAFVAGLAGSLHCFAMCGGIAGALGIRARTQRSRPTGAFAQVSLYHGGRLLGYGTAGALCGALGAALHQMLDLAGLTLALRVLAGALLLAIALKVLFGLQLLRWLERGGAKFWSRIAPLARHAAATPAPAQAVLLGLLWGWLPCGLVYSMLVFAAASGDPSQGATIMLAFGLGTLPAMMSGSVLASQLQRLMQLRAWRVGTGGVLVVLAAATLYLPLQHLLSSHAH